MSLILCLGPVNIKREHIYELNMIGGLGRGMLMIDWSNVLSNCTYFGIPLSSWMLSEVLNLFIFERAVLRISTFALRTKRVD